MGQEQSSRQYSPDDPAETLSARSVDAVAEYIKDGQTKKIVVMTGAGISTSAGIPDFRSPDTGLYANLARLELPYAEAVFDISYFRQNPDPFYVLAKELYPGKFYPTIAHSFIALLDRKSMLEMLFTQNIDCLERRAGVPDEKIVEAHGSFATQRCIECKTEYPDDLMLKAVESGNVPHCVVPQCNGLVKPDIVFFGEALPQSFHQNGHVPEKADLIIVMGTSLSVQPFASLPQRARDGVPRVLINKERVGDFGCRPDDVLMLEDCDAGVRKLADALGWRDELEAMWMEISGKFKEQEADELKQKKESMTKDEALEAEIEKLTSEVNSTLKLSKDHSERVNNHLEKTSPTKVSAGIHQSPEPNQASQSERPSAATIASPSATTEKLGGEKPAEEPIVNTAAILDTTLPHNRSNEESSSSKESPKKPASHI